MNTQANKNSYKASWFIILMAGMIFSATSAAASPVVKIKVNANETALEFDSEVGTGNCAGKNQGDVCVPHDHPKDRIHFQLVGNKTCTADSPSNWELTRVVLAPDSVDKPDTNGWGNISNEAVSDFNAVKTSGVVATVNPTGPNQITIEDKNEYALTVWYKVEAECDGTTIQYDPRIKNGGTG